MLYNQNTSTEINSSEKNNHLIILNDFKNNIFSQLLDFLDSSIEESTKNLIIEKLNDRFEEVYDAYSITRKKFKSRKRNSGEMYITHINGVIDIYISKFFNLKNKLSKLDNNKEYDRKYAIELVKNEISIIGTIIEHDSIEDTDATMEGINERYTINKLVGFTTFLLSKKPFVNCIDNENDWKLFTKIKKTGVLNEKGLIADLIKEKIQLSGVDIVKFTFHDDHKLTDEQLKGLELYYDLEKNYKKTRNELYFKHYKSTYSLIKHALKLIKDRNIFFSVDDFKTIIHNTIVIKLADRIHNLKDLPESWIDKPKSIENKLQETEKFLIPLAKEFNQEIYEYLLNEIIRIRTEITKINTTNIIK